MLMALETPAFEHFSLWSTSVSLGVSNSEKMSEARSILDKVLEDVDMAANRFKPESEIHKVNSRDGMGPSKVSKMFFDLTLQSLWAYRITNRAFDPTILDALITEGYNRDFDEITRTESGRSIPSQGADGIILNRNSMTVDLPPGVHLDFGSLAKARAADLAADSIAHQLNTGVLVSIGGDIRVAGDEIEGGWIVGIAQSARNTKNPIVDEVISISSGGLASSSSVIRQWENSSSNEEEPSFKHHIIDPSTGKSAVTPFKMVSVTGSTCVEANTFSTASIVWGEDALFHLPQNSLPSRLVRIDDSVEYLGNWPEPLDL